ncbi:hypothetical protein ACFC8F_41290, partial [Streptomyces hydrogenans]
SSGRARSCAAAGTPDGGVAATARAPDGGRTAPTPTTDDAPRPCDGHPARRLGDGDGDGDCDSDSDSDSDSDDDTAMARTPHDGPTAPAAHARHLVRALGGGHASTARTPGDGPRP